MKRRLLSAFLAVMMVLTMAPMAFAADEGDVAKIGENGYATLAEAIGSAADGATITMLKNTTVTEEIHFTDKAITLDLNGMTVTGNFSDENSVIEAHHIS